MSNKNWDYRVVRKESNDGSDEWYSVQEVYFDDETGEPMAQTIDLQIEGDTISEIRKRLNRMINCLGQPVLDESDIIPTSSEGSNIETEGFEFPTEGSWIYESPDGGETIFRRKTGEVIRENLKNLRTGKTTQVPRGTFGSGDWQDVASDEVIEQWKEKVKKRGGI